MTRVRSRRRAERVGLTAAERLYLETGSLTTTLAGEDATSVPFSTRDADGWHVSLAAARAAWREYRDEITAETPEGYVPWAARVFDGALGVSNPYEHLGSPAAASVADARRRLGMLQ